MKTLHLKIRALREMRRYTQEHLAEKTSICSKTYRQIEAGRAPVTVERLAQIAVALQVSCHISSKGILNFEPNSEALPVSPVERDLKNRIKELEMTVQRLLNKLENGGG